MNPTLSLYSRLRNEETYVRSDYNFACSPSQREGIRRTMINFVPNLEDSVLYLAMWIYDRYITTFSLEEISASITKEIDNNNLAMCCLFCALKLEKQFASLCEFFQRMFEKDININTMMHFEIHIRSKINLQGKPVTPFDFVDVFSGLLHLSDPESAVVRRRAVSYIHYSHSAIRITRFKQSVIAVSAVLMAMNQLFGSAESDKYKSPLKYLGNVLALKKEGLNQCILEMQDELRRVFCETDMCSTSNAILAVSTGNPAQSVAAYW